MRLVLALSVAGTLLSVVDASYAPVLTECYQTSVQLRSAGLASADTQKLNPAESAYAAERRVKTTAALHSYLDHPLTKKAWGGSIKQLTPETSPNIGIGLSGGGDRAALFGAATLNVFDARNESSVERGLGGILQAATYISALSGGSWLVSSFVHNNMPKIYPMILGDDKSAGWLLDLDLFSPGNTSQLAVYTTGIIADLAEKRVAGFPVTYGDVWGRDIARHYLPGTTASNFFANSTEKVDHGASITMSSVQELGSYKEHELPFPIIVANAYSPSIENDTAGTVGYFDGATIPLRTVIYEFTPLEFGSYDPQLAHFLPMKSLGTPMKAGKVYNGMCATNFDNAGWIAGASSDLFHQYNVSAPAVFKVGFLPTIDRINSTFGTLQPEQQLDISAVANPFYKVRSAVKDVAYVDEEQTQLRLVDGGLDGELDPIAPLAIPARGVDLIIITDAASDSAYLKPEGSAIAATIARAALYPDGTFSLPPLPKTTNTFVAQGLNVRPTFFGCDATPSRLKKKKHAAAYPVLVYLPNYDPTGITNVSTSVSSFTNDETVAILNAADQIGHNGILSKDGTVDVTWATCMACAVVEGARGKTGVDRTSACDVCFKRYCWDGVEDTVDTSATDTTRVKSGADAKQ